MRVLRDRRQLGQQRQPGTAERVVSCVADPVSIPWSTNFDTTGRPGFKSADSLSGILTRALALDIVVHPGTILCLRVRLQWQR